MRHTRRGFTAVLCIFFSSLLVRAQPPAGRWTKEQAHAWYTKEPWLVGSNFVPAYAVNEIEMWQAATFDPKEIDKELGWAQSLGMDTMRVFLHDLLWQQDPEGFKHRIDVFLDICAKHKIKPVFVLFDSCWNPNPHLGPQPPPRPGVHNSQWVQSPGKKALADPSDYPRLEAYVKGVVGAFAKDDRVLAWDIWNEPDNTNNGSYGKEELPDKVQIVLRLLPQAFGWARAANPEQPLTSGVWQGDWSHPNSLEPMAKEQLDLSDITSFHNYGPPTEFETRVKSLQQYGRPIICTEYMARPMHSTFQGILPIAKRDKVGAINWGFVAGKTQTNLAWDTWRRPYVYGPPKVWFHDIFYRNGKPYSKAEVRFIRRMTRASKRKRRHWF